MAIREILEKYSKNQIKKASSIKALFSDVDGVLTDGKIIYDDTGRELKQFNVKDGLIVSYLKKSGIIVGVISGRESEAVAKRCSELKMDFCHQGILDKKSTFEKLVKFHKLKKREVAFIGDDLNDLSILAQCGLAACPADAHIYIKSKTDIVTIARGGKGAFREVADLILESRGRIGKLLKKGNGII